MNRATLQALQELRAAGTAAIVLTEMDGAWQTLLNADLQTLIGPAPGQELLALTTDALGSDRSRVVDCDGERVFVQIFSQPLRMVIIGAVHIAQFLAPMAVLADYQVVVVDPRRSFAADERFPGVSMRKVWPDDALQELRPDARTAIVTLTHDPKIDDPALLEALKSPAFYIGSLGSRRTHAKRVQRLLEAGCSEQSITRIHAPVGLNIHAKSPAEIAVSVLAQVTEVLRA